MAKPPTTGYAPVNGLDMYWESRGGGGVPLIVVHGGFGVTSMFGDLLDRLAERREVFAVELQGHGHTRDIDRPFSYEAFGDDLAGLVEHLDLGQADLLGYSLGGGASLRCAIQHPDLVRRVTLVSAAHRRDAWYPEVLAAMGQINGAAFDMLSRSPLYEEWSKVAPEGASFPALMDRTGELLRRPYDWTDEVKDLAMPTLLVYADADSIPAAQVAEFFALLGGGQRDAGWDGSLAPTNHLAVLPGLTHYNIFTSPQLLPIVEAFIG